VSLVIAVGAGTFTAPSSDILSTRTTIVVVHIR
jgi:hypothetical protein